MNKRLSDEEREALSELEGARCFTPEHFAHLRTLCKLVRRLAAPGPVVDEGAIQRALVAYYKDAVYNEDGHVVNNEGCMRRALTAALERKDHEG